MNLPLPAPRDPPPGALKPGDLVQCVSRRHWRCVPPRPSYVVWEVVEVPEGYGPVRLRSTRSKVRRMAWPGSLVRTKTAEGRTAERLMS